MTEGAKPCSVCEKVKPLAAFDKNGRGGCRAACKPCTRAQREGKWTTPEYRAWQAAYRRRPEVRAKQSEANRRRRAAKRAWEREYRRTPIGKLRRTVWDVTAELKRPIPAARRAMLRARLETCKREIERLKAIYHGEEDAA